MSSLSFLDQFARWFVPAPFLQLARAAHWLRRQGQIDAFEFLTSLVFGQLSALRLTLNAQAQGLAVPVTRQAVAQRYTPAAVAYLQSAFAHCLNQTWVGGPAQPMAHELRAHFAAVYLLDSTAFDVPASLQQLFPACGGDGSPAHVKVLLRYEWMTGRLEPLQLLPGQRSDQGLARQVVVPLRENQLQLQDKGFFSAAALQLAGWLILVTNAPAAKLPSRGLSDLDRARWQIELIFRQCKWVLRLDGTESDNVCRVPCEIWARLLAAVLIFVWHAHTGAACWRAHGCEISFEKVCRLFQQWGHRLARAFLQGGEALRNDLRALWRHILKGARKERQKTRTNTWDRLREVWLTPPTRPLA